MLSRNNLLRFAINWVNSLWVLPLLKVIITVVVTVGGFFTAGAFLLMWEHDWFKAVTVVTAIALVLLLLAAIT